MSSGEVWGWGVCARHSLPFFTFAPPPSSLHAVALPMQTSARLQMLSSQRVLRLRAMTLLPLTSA